MAHFLEHEDFEECHGEVKGCVDHQKGKVFVESTVAFPLYSFTIKVLKVISVKPNEEENFRNT